MSPQPENYALYTRAYDALPAEQMRLLAGENLPSVELTPRGITYTYQWADLTIIVSEMPAAKLVEHLNGFEGYVRTGIHRGLVPPRSEQVISLIRSTRL